MRWLAVALLLLAGCSRVEGAAAPYRLRLPFVSGDHGLVGWGVRPPWSNDPYLLAAQSVRFPNGGPLTLAHRWIAPSGTETTVPIGTPVYSGNIATFASTLHATPEVGTWGLVLVIDGEDAIRVRFDFDGSVTEKRP